MLETQIGFPKLIATKIKKYRDTRVLPFGRHLTEITEVPHPERAVMVNGNDYLQLHKNQSINNAHAIAISQGQISNMMSPSFFERTKDCPITLFEEEIAEFTGFPAGILCQSGHSANMAVLQMLAYPEKGQEPTPVYIDEYAHYSFHEGANTVGAKVVLFRHNNPGSLRKLIGRFGQGIICVDSVYSTEGTICPIADVAEVAESTGCILVVDESHSLGVMGREGRGLTAELNLQDKVHFLTSSLAKTFVSRSGVILGNKEILDTTRLNAYALIFSSFVEPADGVRCREALKQIKQADKQRKNLSRIVYEVQNGLRGLGYAEATRTQIIPWIAGDDYALDKLHRAVEKEQLFGAAFMAPATPKDRGLYRISLHADLADDDIEMIFRVYHQVKSRSLCR